MRPIPTLAVSLAIALSVGAAEPRAAYQVQGLDIYRHVIAFKTEVGLRQVPVMARYDGLEFWYRLLNEVAAPKPLTG
jgi:hypothetical protein